MMILNKVTCSPKCSFSTDFTYMNSCIMLLKYSVSSFPVQHL